jgi:hypothetical protein
MIRTIADLAHEGGSQLLDNSPNDATVVAKVTVQSHDLRGPSDALSGDGVTLAGEQSGQNGQPTIEAFPDSPNGRLKVKTGPQTTQHDERRHSKAFDEGGARKLRITACPNYSS